jgi:hypothetical protein
MIGSPSTGKIPIPVFPELSAISCSIHAPNEENSGSERMVILFLPWRAASPINRA